jgi:hypothetical protein
MNEGLKSSGLRLSAIEADHSGMARPALVSRKLTPTTCLSHIKVDDGRSALAVAKSCHSGHAPLADNVGNATVSHMTYEGGTDYERAGRVAYLGFVVAMLTVGIYAAVKPSRPEPPNSKAFGCYITARAAPILLSRQGMVILQPSRIRMNFHLERHKTGIALTAEAPIAAEPTGQQYTFSVKYPGEGWFLDFYNVVDGRTYGVFDENELRQFTMLATDGAHLGYGKAPAYICRV